MGTVCKRNAALVGALILLAAGCAGKERPVDPAPVGEMHAPMPANVGSAEESAPPADGSSCDPISSLAPQGDIAAGSTMDKIKKRGRLIVGVDQTTFLFGFRNPTNGKLEGFDIDLANEIAKSLFGSVENHIQYRAISSQQRESVLENGDVDIVVRTFTTNCARKKKVNFSSIYYEAGQRVLVPRSSNVTGLAGLGGQKVCAARTSTSLQYIANADSKPIPISVNDWSDCLVLLQQGQVSAISTDDTILAGMQRQDPTTKIVGDRLNKEPYGIGIPQQNEDMVRYVNSVLDAVRGGQWQQSYQRWLQPSLGPSAPPQPTYK